MSVGFYGGLKLNRLGPTHGAAPVRFVPPAVALCLDQQPGGEGIPCVKAGDAVTKGAPVAKSDRLAWLHSPVSGKVAKTARLRGKQYILIKNDGRGDEYPRDPFTAPLNTVSAAAITEKIRRMGVVGSFSRFPAHIKIIAAAGKAFCLVVNCVQSDPYGSFVREAVKAHAEEITMGARILAKAIGVKKVVFAIEKNERSAINALSAAIGQDDPLITIIRPEPRYPLGEERNLLSALFGREVPAGRAPHDIGYAVFSAETVLWVYNACAEGIPVTEKYLTFGGSCFGRPKNIIAPIGSSVKAITEFCGGISGGVLTVGGSLSGRLLSEPDGCIGKSEGLYIALPSKTVQPGECIHCGRCAEVCPMHLSPTEFLPGGFFIESERKLCDGCGCCDTVCPAGISLTDAIRSCGTENRI